MDAALSLRVPLCGLPCAEMRIAPAPSGGVRASGGCPAGRVAAALPIADEAKPAVDGRPVSEAQAVAAAAALLLEARSPFVFGLSMSSCGTARRAAAIARRLGGAIDVEGAAALENDLVALRTFGLASATFGEVRHRADVVLLWRCDPRPDHPHLMPPRLPGDASAERLFILVPLAGETAGGAHAGGATQMLPVADGGDLDALLALRALAARREAGANVSGGMAGGGALSDLHRAAAALRRARYAAMVWDAAATRGPAGPAIAATLALLARDLNVQHRAAARPLGAGGNVAGAMAAILSDCGHPRAVGFSGGSPREAPEAFGAAPMLDGGADALLLIGARSIAVSRQTASDGHSGPRPTHAVVIGPRLPEGCSDPEVFIPTAIPAFSEKGLWLLADGVPVPMRAPLPSTRPSEAEVFDRLIGRVAASGKPASPRRGA